MFVGNVKPVRGSSIVSLDASSSSSSDATAVAAVAAVAAAIAAALTMAARQGVEVTGFVAIVVDCRDARHTALCGIATPVCLFNTLLERRGIWRRTKGSRAHTC